MTTPPPPHDALTVEVDAPTLTVDPGRRWVGIGVRVGADTIDATTIAIPEIGDVNDVRKVQTAIRTTLRAVDAMYDRHEPVFGPLVVVCESMFTPQSLACPRCRDEEIVKRRGKVPIADWLVPMRIADALTGHWDPVGLVPAGWKRTWEKEDFGWRPTLPTRLRGPRPRNWTASEHPENRRAHEQDTHAVGGLAWVWDATVWTVPMAVSA